MSNTQGINFIIFGATGDLSKKRLLPSLYSLFVKKKIQNFAIIGAALDDINTEQFVKQIKEYIHINDENNWTDFSKKIQYIHADLRKNKDYKKIKSIIDDIEIKLNLTNRLIYCSIVPTLFKTTTQYLIKNKILEKQKNEEKFWYRIAYEKPFGIDLKSAKKINKYILKHLNENQIYRIDHFLADVMVMNIPTLIFKNEFFQINKNNIEQINIYLTDNTFNLENRGSFYDAVGTLLDVVQNHLLQLLTLISIKKPKQFDNKSIANEKIKVLKKIKFIDGVLGQYIDYRQEPGVNINSTTETFSTLLFKINNSQWKNVPFLIKTGKCLDKSDISIEIIFKNNNLPKNILKIKIELNPGFELKLNLENPNEELKQILLNFSYNSFYPNTASANELIFEKIIKDDHSISVEFEEIKYAWMIIDKIKLAKLPLYFYKKGSSGPIELKEFKEKYKLE